MVTTLDYFRTLAGAGAAMAMLIATELTLMTAAALGFAAFGGVGIPSDSVFSSMLWSVGSATVAIMLSVLAAPGGRDIYPYVFQTVPLQLLRRTLPLQLIGVGVVELLLLAAGHL